jgi:hypothetical protein
MKRVLIGVVLIVIAAGTAPAQKGTAEPDYYPPNYSGDTWTGHVTAVDENTREFTLTYKKKDKDETFVGVLPKGYTVKLKDGKDHEVKISEMMGMRVKAYYITKTTKVNDQKIKTNEVFKIKFLPQEK